MTSPFIRAVHLTPSGLIRVPYGNMGSKLAQYGHDGSVEDCVTEDEVSSDDEFRAVFNNSLLMKHICKMISMIFSPCIRLK